MDKETIIDYVMNTPHNANRQVLEGMLDGAGSGAGLPAVSEEDEGKVLTVINGEWDKAESSAGYECKDEWVTLTDESITTVATSRDNSEDFAYSTPITADTIRVTFNGAEYSFDKKAPNPDVAIYGNIDLQTGPDFSNYPFAILSTPGGNALITETAGTYQVKIEAFEESIKTSECFEKAVKKASGACAVRVIKPTGESESIVDGNGNSCTAYYYDMTYAELGETMRNGTIVFVQFPMPMGETEPRDVEQRQIVAASIGRTPFEEEAVSLACNSGSSALYTNESGKLYAKYCVSA